MCTVLVYKPAAAVAAAAAAEVTAGSQEPLSDAHVPASASAVPPCGPTPDRGWTEPHCLAESLQHQQHYFKYEFLDLAE